MTTAHSQRPLVVIADDEDLGRLLLSEAAQECGLEPLAFDNGLAALQACLSREVAIVLLDVDMPGLNGFEVCRRLRAESGLANVPIVMVTGNEDQAAVSLAFEAGATDFISKPVNWALLPRRLSYILRNAAAAERIDMNANANVSSGSPQRRGSAADRDGRPPVSQRRGRAAAGVWVEPCGQGERGSGAVPGEQAVALTAAVEADEGRRCAFQLGRGHKQVEVVAMA